MKYTYGEDVQERKSHQFLPPYEAEPKKEQAQTRHSTEKQQVSRSGRQSTGRYSKPSLAKAEVHTD